MRKLNMDGLDAVYLISMPYLYYTDRIDAGLALVLFFYGLCKIFSKEKE